MNLILHPVTEQELTGFTQQPAQTLILAGPTGSGKTALANWLAATILDLPEDKLQDYPYHLRLSMETALGIESVRELEHFLSLKVPRDQTNNRVVIIEGAQSLSLEAQNALLKTLEEPPDGTLIMLTVDSEQSLLPTIRSRAQIISVKKPPKQLLDGHFQTDNFEDSAITQAYAVSGGLPGLMSALLTEAEHPLIQATERARQLLNQTVYERLLQVDEIARQKDLAKDIVFILQQMAHVSLRTATDKKAARWQSILEASYQSGEALAANAQPKLVLTNLMLSF